MYKTSAAAVIEPNRITLRNASICLRFMLALHIKYE
ncbi:hypothetical protein CFII64_27103 [Pseudomonas sp. CFII64]|nr:hypothetical protein CFII64_27103 [Pseudomonas sp. CFII64]